VKMCLEPPESARICRATRKHRICRTNPIGRGVIGSHSARYRAVA
jgi:hypothetical protein